MSVLGTDALNAPKFTSVADALRTVPGIGMVEGAQAGGNTIAVRGVASGGNLFFGSSTTAYYLDAVPFGFVNSAFAPDSNAFDLDRVEVLRGPQGTLYGAAALNGVVRVLTKSPDLSDFGLSAQTNFSHTEQGDPSYRGDVAVNVPLIDGKLAVRVVGGYEDRGGWVDKPNLGKEDVNSGTRRNLRGRIKAQPTDELSIELSAWHARDEFDGFSSADRGWTSPAVADESTIVNYDVYGATLSYDLSPFTISSTTGYMKYYNESVIDFDWGITGIVVGTVNDADFLSEELLLSSKGDGPWRWTGGAIYRVSKERLEQTFDGSVPGISAVTTKSTSGAVFGELTREFGNLELLAGLRYFKDQIAVDGPAFHSQNKVDNFSPRVVLTWHPADDALLYASYARGFRSGGPAGFGGTPTVKPDTLNNYEVGAKGDFLDGLLAYDVSVYFMDWQDIQQTRTITLPSGIPISARLNGDSASGFGSDVSLTLQPIRNLAVRLNASWNDLQLDEDVPSVVAGQTVVFAQAGDRIPFSPKYTAGISADYSFPLGGSGLEGVISGSATRTSEQIFRTVLFDQILTQLSDNTVIGRTSFTIQSPRNWQMTLFVNNINNEKGIVAPDIFNFAPLRARPRTMGVQLGYKF